MALPLSARAAGDAGPAPSAQPGATRIVSLTPAITETLFALGLGDRVVGVSTYCDYPPAAATRPRVGTFSEPVAEAIVALAPDLVITSPSPGNESAVRAIERTGVRVAVVRAEGGLDEARGAIVDVAVAAGVRERGDAMVVALDARFASVRARAASLPHPSVAVVVGREPLVLAGPATYLGELVTMAGGVNVAERLGGRWPRTGAEFLVVAAPEVLVDLSSAMDGRGDASDPAASWPALSSVPAVANGRVVGDAGSVMLRPGPRLGDAADAMFAALHPAPAPGAAAAMPAAAPVDVPVDVPVASVREGAAPQAD